MIETENIIYLQMQKTASTFIENELSKNFKIVKHKKHAPLSPAALIKNKKIISSIRNPFSWYLSLWNYRGGIYKRTTQLFLKQGIDDFFEIPGYDLCALFSPIKRQFMRNNMKNLYSSKSQKLMFKKWFYEINDPSNSELIDYKYKKSGLASNVGYMTFRLLYLSVPELLTRDKLEKCKTNINEFYNKNSAVHFYIKQENLNEDLNYCLKSYGKIKDPKISQTKVNTSPSKSKDNDVNNYYDEDMIKIIKSRDKFIFDTFRY